MRCTTRVAEVVDKGPGRGAILYLARTLTDQATGARLAMSTMAAFCRADGGFGGPVTQAPPPHAIPDRAPDEVATVALPLNAALLYRLSGDYNPLHADPAFAARAGFSRPILHGLQPFGEVARLVLQGPAGGDPARLQAMGCRFTGTLFPGDAVQVQLWREPQGLAFRVRPVGREGVALDNGWVRLAD